MSRHRHLLPSLVFTTLIVVLVALTFSETPRAETQNFSNTSTITMPSSGNATPYPSRINVQGMTGRITSVVVGLRGFAHVFPRDVDILLVSPDGVTSVVMSDACGNASVSNSALVVGSDASAAMPQNAPCDGIVYKPTNFDGGVGDAWSGAPAGPHVADFDRFRGGDPNGEWALYVVDDEPQAAGKIASGWSLTIQTAEPNALVPGNGGAGLADPYPITRTVSGLNGVTSDVDVSLSGVFHERVEDMNLLLRSPSGDSVVLQSDACRGTARRDATWTWDDEAAAEMPAVGACKDGRYKPTALPPDLAWPSPAPGRPYGLFLSDFDYTDPNGAWSLYAFDDDPSAQSGFFLDRFTLDIKTRPRGQVTFTEPAASITEGQTGELTLSRYTAGQGGGPAKITLTAVPGTATPGADFQPTSATVEFRREEQTKTVPIRALADALTEGDETLELQIASATGDAVAPAPAKAVVTIRDVPPPPAPQPPAPPAPPLPPTPPGSPPVPPRPVDRTPPQVGGLAVTRKLVRFRLTEPATVRVDLQRRSGRRWVKAGRLRATGKAGANRLRFDVRTRRALRKRGRVRVVVTAADAAGNRSSPRVRALPAR